MHEGKLFDLAFFRAWIQKVLSEGRGGGPTLTAFVLVSLMNGKTIQIPLKAGHHRHANEKPVKRAIIGPPAPFNGVSLAGRLWFNIEGWLGSFLIFQGIRTSIAKKPYIFVIFQGGG